MKKSRSNKILDLRPKLAAGCNNRSLRHSPLVRARANDRLGPTVSYGEQGANTGGHLRRQTETQARTQTLGGDSLPEHQETKERKCGVDLFEQHPMTSSLAGTVKKLKILVDYRRQKERLREISDTNWVT